MSKRQVQKSEGGQRATNNKNKQTQGKATKSPGQAKMAPVAQAHVVKTQKAKLKTMPNGDCVITHREYIGEIVSSPTLNAFSSKRYAVNAGDQQTFAWLSTLAQNFESYRFEKLIFDFETEAATTIGGSVILAVDYDSTDKAPITKQMAMTYRNSVRSPPWSDSKHISSQEDLNKRKSYFVGEPGPQRSDFDSGQRLSDVGNLFVCTQGMLANTTAGELYVTYRCRLMTPVYGPETKVGVFLNSGGFFCTPAKPFGTETASKPLPAYLIPRGQLVIVPVPDSALGYQQFEVYGCQSNRSYYVSTYILGGSITGKMLLTFTSATVNITSESVVAAQVAQSSMYAITPNSAFETGRTILITVSGISLTTFSSSTQAGFVVTEQPLES